MLPWFRSSPADAEVRLEPEPDVRALLRFARQNERSHIHADWWPLEHYLAAGPCITARLHDRTIALLACPADPSPAAWLRALAVADGWPAGPLVERLLAAGVDALAAQGVTELAVMHVEKWLAERLAALDFAPLTRVVTLRTTTLDAPAEGNPAVRVRPARPEDLPALAAAEAGAFAPLWRLSRGTLERMLGTASTFTVAELDGVPAGFQFSSLYGEHGHLVRLTVRSDLQGRGIGTRLLADLFRLYAVRGLRSVSLNTQAENTVAQQLYARFGFRLTSEALPVWRRALAA